MRSIAVQAAIVVAIGILVTVAATSSFPAVTVTTSIIQPAEAFIDPNMDKMAEPRKAPTVVSGDNIYIAWWTNNTENRNEEIMFRASTDGGATFSDKINLSNSSEADSWRVELHGEGDTVVVSWWETNQTSDIPVARVSNDGGETFGPMLMLATNGTIASTEEEGGEGEGE